MGLPPKKLMLKWKENSYKWKKNKEKAAIWKLKCAGSKFNNLKKTMKLGGYMNLRKSKGLKFMNSKTPTKRKSTTSTNSGTKRRRMLEKSPKGWRNKCRTDTWRN